MNYHTLIVHMVGLQSDTKSRTGSLPGFPRRSNFSYNGNVHKRSVCVDALLSFDRRAFWLTDIAT